MECRISSLLHLNLMISQKYIQLVKNILLGKTWSKCVVELSNIPFSQMFTCFSYARQNVAEKMEIIAGELPKYKQSRGPKGPNQTLGPSYGYKLNLQSIFFFEIAPSILLDFISKQVQPRLQIISLSSSPQRNCEFVEIESQITVSFCCVFN